MPSENYRYYSWDVSGRLQEAAWFKAVSDQSAVRQIEAKYPDLKCEVWQGSRLVATIFPQPSTSIHALAT